MMNAIKRAVRQWRTRNEAKMYTGTLISDLLNLVDRVDDNSKKQTTAQAPTPSSILTVDEVLSRMSPEGRRNHLACVEILRRREGGR